MKDVEKGHDHGAGDPHAHDWDWSGKKPDRKDARTLTPEEAAKANPRSAPGKAWDFVKTIPPKRVHDAGTAAIIVFLIVSEGSRLIPARNLVPVP